MGLGDFILCILLPPLASGVRKRGVGAILLVLVLCVFAWVPGIIAAAIMTLSKPKEPQVIIVQQPPAPPQ